MPRLKTVIGEIGTSQVFERVPITSNASNDIGRAVELEHYCTDNHCDIDAARDAGFPIAAAHLLSGATETPLLDAVCAAHGMSAYRLDDHDEWHQWVGYAHSVSRQCQSCESYIYDEHSTHCDNCGAELQPLHDESEE